MDFEKDLNAIEFIENILCGMVENSRSIETEVLPENLHDGIEIFWTNKNVDVTHVAAGDFFGKTGHDEIGALDGHPLTIG
jgi:hypothetical protein